MAINANTGGSVHHTILLWPLPQFVVAVSFAGVSRRLGRAGVPLLAVAFLAMVVSAALVVNEAYVVAFRYGGAQAWTDAVMNLSEYAKNLQARSIFCMDWGICDQLRLLHAGRLPLGGGSDQIAKPELTADDRVQIDRMIQDPANVFIAHTKEYEFFPGHSAKLIEYAKGAGLAAEMLQVVPDNYGRNVYEVYKFRRQ